MQSNILVVAPYRQADGWGDASTNLIRSLQTIEGLNLTLRPIYMGSRLKDKVEESFETLEQNVYEEYDYVLQLVLPNYLLYNSSFKKNIGMSFFEFRDLQCTGWIERINLMDAYFVTTQNEKDALLESGVKIPVHVIAPGMDITKYQQSYKNLFPNNKNFKFYFIGEFVSRKNLQALMTAFHREFSINEPVDLVIKTSVGGANFEQSQQVVNGFIHHVKSVLRLYPKAEDYKKEILIVDYLEEKDLMSIHTSCDCFVNTSHGESLCLPAVDALCFGKYPIVTGNTGMTEFIKNNENGQIISSTQENVFCEIGPGLTNVYTGRESWQNINIKELQQAMRGIYTRSVTTPCYNIDISLEDFSYSTSGKQIKEKLCLI